MIPGVAIATALMPPLCTAGYGLATAQWNYFFGAFYLFFINTVFIALATFIGVKMLRFHSYTNLAPGVERRGKRLVTVVVVVAMIPAAVMTVNIVQKDILARNMKDFVDNELAQSGTQIIDHRAEHDTLRVVAVGRNISDEEIAEAQSRMAQYKMKNYSLMVIQGTDSRGLESLASQVNSIALAADATNRQLADQVADLEGQLRTYTLYDTLGSQIDAEAQALFPQVEHVGVGRVGGGTVAIVHLRRGARLADADRSKMDKWLLPTLTLMERLRSLSPKTLPTTAR